MNAEELSLLASCQWSAVFTTRRDPDFSSNFIIENQRNVRELSDLNGISSRILSRTKLPVIRIFGVDGGEDNQSADFLKEAIAPGCYLEDADDILRMLPSVMEHINPLVIVGINNHVDRTVLRKKALLYLDRNASNGSVSFWNLREPEPESEDSGYYRTIVEEIKRKNFERYDNSLQSIILADRNKFKNAIQEEIEVVGDSSSDVFYRAQRAIALSAEDYLLFRNTGTLLTEREVNRIRPYGIHQHKLWFANFLNLSSVAGPQWYGYPQSLFYVKRSYENTLVELVRDLLSGKMCHNRTGQPLPVILSGHPGSSKTITLGALAYRIYNERINPVIFISNPSFLKENFSAKLESLDECIRVLEGNETDTRRVLVIWDSSTYRQVVGDAKNLLQALLNRGRRVVLVCSSYSLLSHYEDDLSAVEYYQYNSENSSFTMCKKEKAQVIKSQDCYFVNATRRMDEREKAHFWERVTNYSGLNRKSISAYRANLKESNKDDIFDHYYWLITLLRRDFENRLRDERSRVYNYVNSKLNALRDTIQEDRQEEVRSSPIYRAFLDAGYDPQQLEKIVLSSQCEVEGESENTSGGRCLEECLDDFNACVALFSRFNLEVPYSLAYTILTDNNGHAGTSNSNQELFRTVTTDLPWLYYGEGMDGDFAFRFRTSLEAQIYLDKNDISGEKQVKLLCWIIQLYGKEYKSSKCVDICFTENLQSLLRLVGPNSSYAYYQTSYGDREHSKIIRHLDEIIDSIRSLTSEYGVPDEDGGFATLIITFTREFYGAIGWDRVYCTNKSTAGDFAPPWEVADDPSYYTVPMYEKRITCINEAIACAEENIDRLNLISTTGSLTRAERYHYNRQRNTLTVEMSLCKIRVDELAKQYRARCEYEHITPDEKYASTKIQYRVIFDRLIQVMRTDPLNGYAYNCLFSAFEKMYLSESDSERKLSYLSEIMLEVENCEMILSRIENRGSNDRDELSEHLNKIRDFSAGFSISIDTILDFRQGKEPTKKQERIFCDVYENKLSRGDPSAITFLCQKEISSVSNLAVLNDAGRKHYVKAYNFMTAAENYECISKSSYAVAMLIRITWAMFNGTKLNSVPECQLTKMTRNQWGILKNYCSLYDDISPVTNKQPIFLLAYALSELQVSGFSPEGYSVAKEILDRIHEDLFYQPRMWTPFIVCNEEGEPVKYTGTVISVKDNNGFIRVNGIPVSLGRDKGIRYRRSNLGRKVSAPAVNDVLKELEIGIGYTGFSVYKEAGRKVKNEGEE